MPRPEPQSWAWDRLGAAARACYRRGWPRGKRSTAGRAGIDRRPAQEVQRQPGELGAGRQQEQPDSIGADEGLNPLSGVRVQRVQDRGHVQPVRLEHRHGSTMQRRLSRGTAGSSPSS